MISRINLSHSLSTNQRQLVAVNLFLFTPSFHGFVVDYYYTHNTHLANRFNKQKYRAVIFKRQTFENCHVISQWRLFHYLSIYFTHSFPTVSVKKWKYIVSKYRLHKYISNKHSCGWFCCMSKFPQKWSSQLKSMIDTAVGDVFSDSHDMCSKVRCHSQINPDTGTLFWVMWHPCLEGLPTVSATF